MGVWSGRLGGACAGLALIGGIALVARGAALEAQAHLSARARVSRMSPGNHYVRDLEAQHVDDEGRLKHRFVECQRVLARRTVPCTGNCHALYIRKESGQFPIDELVDSDCVFTGHDQCGNVQLTELGPGNRRERIGGQANGFNRAGISRPLPTSASGADSRCP